MGSVRSGVTGSLIICFWDDCESVADDRHQAVESRPPDDHEVAGVLAGTIKPTMTYLFCSERHRAYWLHSHRANGQLPIGSRGMLT